MSFNVGDDELKDALLEFDRELRAAPAGMFEDPKWVALHVLLGLVVARLTYDDRSPFPEGS